VSVQRRFCQGFTGCFTGLERRSHTLASQAFNRGNTVKNTKAKVATGATVVLLGGLGGLALSQGNNKAPSKPVADKPIVHTKVIRRTIHVTKHAKPKHPPAAAPVEPASGMSSSSAPVVTGSSGASATEAPPVSTGSSSTGTESAPAPVTTHSSGASAGSGGGGNGIPVTTTASGAGGGSESAPVSTGSSGGGGGGGEVESEGGGGGDD
jgi:hypothetical protein